MTAHPTLAISGNYIKISVNIVMGVWKEWKTCQVLGSYHQNNLVISELSLLLLLMQNSILWLVGELENLQSRL